MLTFLDKLDDEQIANAEKVAKAARRAGVDPKLAVALAFKESSLRANPPRGAAGDGRGRGARGHRALQGLGGACGVRAP